MASIFGRDFVRAFNPAFQQGMASEADRRRAIEQDVMLRNRMETERKLIQEEKDRELERSLRENLAQLGAAPVMNPDGTMNRTQSFGVLGQAKDAKDRQRDNQRRTDDYNFDLGARGRAVGVNTDRPQFQTGHSLSPATIGRTVSPEQAILEAEEGRKIEFARRQEAERLAAYNQRDPAAVRNSRALADARRELFEASKGREKDPGRWNDAVSDFRYLSKDLTTQDPEAENLLQSTGAMRRPIPTSEINDLNSQFRVAGALGNLAKDVYSTAAEIGNGDIEEGINTINGVLGLGQDETNRFLRRFIADDKTRNRINDMIQNMRLAASDFRKSQYGAALTGVEVKNFKEEFGDPGQADFLRAALNFSRVRMDNLASLLDNYDANGYNVLKTQRDRLGELRGFLTPAAQAVGTRTSIDDGQPDQPASGGAPAGVPPDVWNAMTPEEKALWK